jgi:O-antigen/teichoic acid export membrane protein
MSTIRPIASIRNAVLSAFGVDKAIVVTLVTRTWTMLAGIVTIVFIAHFLTPTLQGYYYTLNSLISLQILVELGFTVAITQFCSHEMANLHWSISGTVEGNPAAKQRLRSVLLFSTAWFSGAGAVLIVLLGPLGFFYFTHIAHPVDQNVPSAILPWFLLVCTTALNLLVTAFMSIIEGCGKIVSAAQTYLFQAVASTTTIWFFLFKHTDLYALAAGTLMRAMVGAVIIIISHRTFLSDLFRFRADSPPISWRKEIWPFQWRIAVTWISGYFIFNLFTPYLLAVRGPVEAGQMGISLQIASAIGTAATVWITTKAPVFGQLVARNDVVALDRLFWRSLKQSLIFLSSVFAMFLLVLFYFQRNYPAYYSRVLPLGLFCLIAIVCFANHIFFAQAAYLRAHKQEPFMVISIANAIVTTALCAVFIPKLGLSGAVLAYLVATLLVSLLAGSLLFFQKRREWSYSA